MPTSVFVELSELSLNESETPNSRLVLVELSELSFSESEMPTSRSVELSVLNESATPKSTSVLLPPLL